MISRFRWIDRIRFSCIRPSIVADDKLACPSLARLLPRSRSFSTNLSSHFCSFFCLILVSVFLLFLLLLLLYISFWLLFWKSFDWGNFISLSKRFQNGFYSSFDEKRNFFESRKFYSWINLKFWSCSVGRRKTYSSCSKTGEYLLPPLSGSKIIMNAWWTGINFYEGLSTRERPLLCL